MIYELVGTITMEIALTRQTEVSEVLQQLFEHKQGTPVTQDMRKVLKLKTQTRRRQKWKLCLGTNIYRLCSGVMKFGGYSIGIAQNGDEIKEKLNFRICPNSTISPLASTYDMSKMHCFSIGGMKKQHDAILQSFGTTDEIIYSFTSLPSKTYSLLSSSLSYS